MSCVLDVVGEIVVMGDGQHGLVVAYFRDLFQCILLELGELPSQWQDLMRFPCGHLRWAIVTHQKMPSHSSFTSSSISDFHLVEYLFAKSRSLLYFLYSIAG